MFRIKICGITSVEDAAIAAAAGADALGFNFYPKSPRYLRGEDAKRVIAATPRGVVRVGLFVNADAAEVCDAFDSLALDLIQLHGDESPEYAAQLRGRPFLRAFRIGPEGLAPVLGYSANCQSRQTVPQCVLLDAHAPGEFGGTGKIGDWGAAAVYAAMPGVPPLVLAGGLTPGNVAEAIRTVHPAAVDTASGVESSPGRKDPALVEAFVREATRGLNAGAGGWGLGIEGGDWGRGARDEES
jgi:phosphoribosylanthranilate isomerase